MKSYPIWHEVSACHYKSSKSYGGMNNSEDKILVGSSINNSYELIKTKTSRRFYIHEKYGNVCSFVYFVDGVSIKEMLFKNSNGKAGEFIKTRTKLKSIKGLI